MLENATINDYKKKGYQQDFVYLYYKQTYPNKKFRKDWVEKLFSILINGGEYSYLEIAKKFKLILGVSGTIAVQNKVTI